MPKPVTKNDATPVALEDAEIDRVDGVLGPANGAPFLLVKAQGAPDLDSLRAVAKATGRELDDVIPDGYALNDDGSALIVKNTVGDAASDQTRAHAVATDEVNASGATNHALQTDVQVENAGPAAANGTKDLAPSENEPGSGPPLEVGGVTKVTVVDPAVGFTLADTREVVTKERAEALIAAGDYALDGTAPGGRLLARKIVKADSLESAAAVAAVAPIPEVPESVYVPGVRTTVDGTVIGDALWEAADAANLRAAIALTLALQERVEAAYARESAEGEWDASDELWCAGNALDCILGLLAKLAVYEEAEAGLIEKAKNVIKSLSATRKERAVSKDATTTEITTEVTTPTDTAAADVTKTETPAATDAATSVEKVDPAPTVTPTAESVLDDVEKQAHVGVYQRGGSGGTATLDGDATYQHNGGLAADGVASGFDPDASYEMADPMSPTYTMLGKTFGMKKEIIDQLPVGVVAELVKKAQALTNGGAAPAVPAAAETTPVEKSTESTDEGEKSALLKSIVSEAVQAAVEPLRDRVEKMEKQPMPGGPVLRGAGGTSPHPAAWLIDGSRVVAADVVQPVEKSGLDQVQAAVAAITDPVARERASREVAKALHPALTPTE